MPIGDVKAWFQAQISVVSLGVILNGETFGLITRDHLSQQLIGQINKPSFLKQPISDIMITNPLAVEAGQDLDSVVMRLIQEKGQDDEFFNDIIVKEGGRFVGLLSVRDLLVNHFENLAHKLTAMEAQLASLAQKNKELFANSFRVGHQEGQFKQILEAIPVPVVMFTDDGRLAYSNRRFMELLDYTPKTIQSVTRFKELFDEPFGPLYQRAVKNWQEAVQSDEERCLPLTARTRSGDPVRSEAYFELMPDGRHVCITLADIQEQEAAPEVPARTPVAVPVPDVIPVEKPTRPMGKVTQAIRLKLSNENAMGLARAVATNLIDRDENIEKLMKKVEAIIKVSEQIEQAEPAPVPETPAGAQASVPSSDRPPLRGNLSDFSLIDLCQILVQGTKTGHLRLQFGSGSGGDVYFYCGAIVHACTDKGDQGMDALPVLMRESQGSFEFNFDVGSPAQSIEGDAMGILMDACRLADESAR
jgi:PAS domain-containing protein/Asp-tRNA(Asn)/Glu-tRNA(Gln) amidotransferase C subunit